MNVILLAAIKDESEGAPGCSLGGKKCLVVQGDVSGSQWPLLGSLSQRHLSAASQSAQAIAPATPKSGRSGKSADFTADLM